MISAGAQIAVDRDNDKNPVVALREVADATISPGDLKEDLIHALQNMSRLMSRPETVPLIGGSGGKVEADDVEVTADRMTEEELLRVSRGWRRPRRGPRRSNRKTRNSADPEKLQNFWDKDDAPNQGDPSGSGFVMHPALEGAIPVISKCHAVARFFIAPLAWVNGPVRYASGTAPEPRCHPAMDLIPSDGNGPSHEIGRGPPARLRGSRPNGAANAIATSVDRLGILPSGAA